MAVYWLKYRGTRFPVRRGETILGRSPYCSIVVSNGLVSREHAALRLTSEGLQLVDLGSTNGTKVNGEPVTGGRALKSGDLIAIGTDLLEVLEVDSSGKRGALSTQREAEGSRAEEEDADTLTYRGTLELVETLVASAAEASDPMLVTPTIQRALSGVLDAIDRSGGPIPRGVAIRIAGLAERVAALAGNGSLDDWRTEVAKRAARAVK